MEIIEKYFPKITVGQHAQFQALDGLYREWNAKINVVSRKDIDNLYLHHVLHSMAIAKWITFMPNAKILDLGCGGGFPGIPLAILFPEVSFHLVDSIGKKLKVVDAIVEEIGLQNIRSTHMRAEEIKDKYDFVVTRAVADASKLLAWTQNKIKQKHMHSVPNGLVALKGGRIYDEMKPHKKREYYEIQPLAEYFDEPFFEEKYLVYVQR